jgi:hypothetical protein
MQDDHDKLVRNLLYETTEPGLIREICDRLDIELPENDSYLAMGRPLVLAQILDKIDRLLPAEGAEQHLRVLNQTRVAANDDKRN